MTAPSYDDNSIGEEGAISLQVVTFLLAHRRLIATFAGTLFVIVVLALSLAPPRYRSVASFVPQTGSSQTSTLAGVAAQLGVMPTGADVTQQPAFYVDLLTSRAILSAVLVKEYHYTSSDGAQSGTLLDLLRVTAPTSTLRMDKAIERLSRALQVNFKARTGVVSLDVQMPDPMLAQLVAQSFLDEVSRFNLEQRQTRAGAERRFTDGRLVQVQRELRDAEDRLQTFLQGNRDVRNSPELSAQRDRLVREIDFRQIVFTTVAQSNEKARIDEARDTPVINVVDRPSLAGRPEGRGRLQWGVLALLFGAALGAGVGYIRTGLARRRALGDREYAELRAVAAEAGQDLRRVFFR